MYLSSPAHAVKKVKKFFGIPAHFIQKGQRTS